MIAQMLICDSSCAGTAVFHSVDKEWFLWSKCGGRSNPGFENWKGLFFFNFSSFFYFFTNPKQIYNDNNYNHRNMPPPPRKAISESESILTHDYSKTYSSYEEQAIDSTGESQEVNRRKNYEEDLPFICNFFYWFYCPYVCRIKQVHEEDVPTPAPQDKSDYTFPTLRETWDPLYDDYLTRLRESQNGTTTFGIYAVSHFLLLFLRIL